MIVQQFLKSLQSDFGTFQQYYQETVRFVYHYFAIDLALN